MELWNTTRQVQLAGQLLLATTFFRRLKGLLGTDSLPAGAALLIAPCSGVHTLGMRYSIDVLFMSKAGTVLKIVADLPPARMAGGSGSAYVLELPAGTAALSRTTVGDTIICREKLL